MAPSILSYHGKSFEATVVGCTGLRDTEWLKKQKPYVHLEYGTTKWRTRSCSDEGINPTFQQKFLGSLIGGTTEMTVEVWARKTLSADRFIGSGKVVLKTFTSTGLDNRSWPIVDKSNRYSGEVKLLLYCEDLNNQQMFMSPAQAYQYHNQYQPPIYHQYHGAYPVGGVPVVNCYDHVRHSHQHKK